MSGYLAFLRDNARWLLAGLLLSLGSSFGQTFFISIFAGEIRAEFGLSHGDWGAIYALATMASAAVMVYAGGLTDRFRVRQIGLVVVLGLSGAMILMAVGHSVWLLVVAIFLLRLMGQGMMSHTAITAMARWFVATRGRAIAVAGLGVALGEALLPLTFVTLLGLFDWRHLWLFAACVLLILSPVLHRLLRDERTPQSFALNQGSLGIGARNWTRGEVMRSAIFWLMIPAIIGPPMWGTAFFFHQVHTAEVKGWSHLALVALFPVFTVSGIVSLQACGWLVDRFGSARLATAYLVPVALGYVVFGATQSLGAAAVAMVLMGASGGAHGTLSATLWAEFFGTAHLGRIRAMTGALMVLGSALGPGITGWLIDHGWSFPQQAYGIAVYFLVASVLTTLAALRGQRLLAGQAEGGVLG